MALSFPLEMPTDGFTASLFKLIPTTSKNRLRSGASFGTEITPQYWQASITTFPVYKRDKGKWEGFFDAQRDGVKSCLLYNPAREYPAYYENFDGLVIYGGATPFVGEATLAAITDQRNITVASLPANFVLYVGDLVGLIEGGRYSLHRIQEDVTGTAIGSAELVLEPPVPSTYTTSAEVHFYQPKAEFIVDNTSISGLDDIGAPQPISFTATSRTF